MQAAIARKVRRFRYNFAARRPRWTGRPTTVLPAAEAERRLSVTFRTRLRAGADA